MKDVEKSRNVVQASPCFPHAGLYLYLLQLAGEIQSVLGVCLCLFLTRIQPVGLQNCKCSSQFHFRYYSDHNFECEIVAMF